MNPVAFEIFGIEVRWYGILMALAMVVGSYFVVKWGKTKGYKEDTMYNFLLVMLPSAVIGSRIYYVIFEWEHYQGDFMKMINFREGGLAIHGGIIGGLIGGYIFCKINKMNFAEMTDLVAPGLILGQAIGRWGNFMNNEAHGGPTDLPWGIMVDGVKVHPTFLYESIWNLLIFFFLVYLLRMKRFDGQIFLAYGILYSIGRFFIEGLRTDSLYLGPLRVAQVVSIAMIVGFSLWYYLLNRRKKDTL